MAFFVVDVSKELHSLASRGSLACHLADPTPTLCHKRCAEVIMMDAVLVEQASRVSASVRLVVVVKQKQENTTSRVARQGRAEACPAPLLEASSRNCFV